MKKFLILYSLLTFTFISFGQTNRYSTVSTSTYKPISVNEVMSSYDQAGASENVLKSAIYYWEKIKELSDKDTDYQFKADINNAKSYLTPIIIEQRPMNIENAKWYVKKSRKAIKKAIRKYNKRLKKSSKS